MQQFRAQARQNLLSEPGKALRAGRSTEVETVFWQIKHNMQFRRFLLRGQAKVQTEWRLVYMAHNMKKLANRTASFLSFAPFTPFAKTVRPRRLDFWTAPNARCCLDNED